MMVANRKQHRSSPISNPRPTLVRRHNENISTFLRHLPKAEKVRMIQIESEWDTARMLSVISRLDDRQRKFIDAACGTATVPEILEALGMKRYAQLLAFLAKLDVALVQMEVHPSEVYYTTQALYGRQSVITNFDLTLNFGGEYQAIAPFPESTNTLVMRVFHRFCDAARLLKGDLSRTEFFVRVFERVRDDKNLQPLSAVPAELVREQQASEIASILADAFSEASAPDFAIPEQVINEFVSTITDEQVFKLLLVRSAQ